jgi:hypothetical protein
MSMATSAQDVLAERMPGDDTFLSAAELRAYMDKVALAKASNDVGAMGSAEAARRAMIAKLSKPIEITPPMRQGLLTNLRVAAENGETELMLLRYNNEPDWPQALSGVPAQLNAAIVAWPDGRGRLLSPLGPIRPGLTARRHV